MFVKVYKCSFPVKVQTQYLMCKQSIHDVQARQFTCIVLM